MLVRVSSYDTIMTSQEKEELQKALNYLLANKNRFLPSAGVSFADELNFDVLQKIFLGNSNPQKT